MPVWAKSRLSVVATAILLFCFTLSSRYYRFIAIHSSVYEAWGMGRWWFGWLKDSKVGGWRPGWGGGADASDTARFKSETLLKKWTKINVSRLQGWLKVSRLRRLLDFLAGLSVTDSGSRTVRKIHTRFPKKMFLKVWQPPLYIETPAYLCWKPLFLRILTRGR